MPIFERMTSLLRRFHLWIRKTPASLDCAGSKRGQTLAEYALVLALISVVAITVLEAMGNQASAVYGTINSQLKESGNGGQTTSSHH